MGDPLSDVGISQVSWRSSRHLTGRGRGGSAGQLVQLVRDSVGDVVEDGFGDHVVEAGE